MFSRINKSFHKWLSLFVGIQLLIWLGSGLYFNLMDHKKAGGNSQRLRLDRNMNYTNLPLLPISELDQGPVGESADLVESVKLVSILNRAVYVLTKQKTDHSYLKQSVSLVDAITGLLFVIEAVDARSIAIQSYTGDAQITSTRLVNPPIDELPRQQNTLWQVSFDDDVATNVYISQHSGKVIAHIDDDRRLRDLMFTLHFMDYGNSGGFNHWLVICFAIACLLLSLTGAVWVIQLIKDRQYQFSFSKRKRSITVNFIHSPGSTQHKISVQKPLLGSLGDVDIHLASSCGGGGTCGKCRFKTNKAISITSADRALLTQQQLDDGVRLGCQHSAEEVDSIELEENLDVQQLDLNVTSSRFITPFIKEISFKTVNGQKLSYRAGAFMRFHIPPGKSTNIPEVIPEQYQPYWSEFIQDEYKHTGATRHYSLANDDSQNDELTFTVRWQTAPAVNLPSGTASSHLSSLAVGDKITATGPFEEFKMPPDSNKAKVFIGAGSGMAPLKAMVFEHLCKYKKPQTISYFFGARGEVDLLYFDHLTQLESEYRQFSFIPVLSRPGQQWQGKTGYVQQHLSEFLNDQVSLKDIEFYLCGPKAMMDDVLALLASFDICQQNIFKDDFSR